jgi:hypothetical protein
MKYLDREKTPKEILLCFVLDLIGGTDVAVAAAVVAEDVAAVKVKIKVKKKKRNGLHRSFFLFAVIIELPPLTTP